MTKTLHNIRSTRSKEIPDKMNKTTRQDIVLLTTENDTFLAILVANGANDTIFPGGCRVCQVRQLTYFYIQQMR